MTRSIRHDLDGATPEDQALHLAYSREDLEVDLEGYATEKWVLSKKYITKKDLPETAPPSDQPLPDYEHTHDEYAPVDHKHPDYASDIADLQEGFDEAVLAAQEGAENIEIELQSYSKKDHTHDYAAKNHSHNYAAKDHTHDYAPKSHTHNYAAKDHNHSGTYVRGGFQITKSNGCFYIQ